jgi:hypothetical protein
MTDKTDRELLEDMSINLATLTEKVLNSCNDVERHEELLNGNGKPGLKDDLSVVKTKVSLLIWGVSVVAAAAITGAVGTLWGIIAK